MSNLLRSGFRESLDQLIQSYVQRQSRSPIDWDLHRHLPTPVSMQNEEEERDEQNDDQEDSVVRPLPVMPSPPVPPPQPFWRPASHRVSWNRHGLHRSDFVSAKK